MIITEPGEKVKGRSERMVWFLALIGAGAITVVVCAIVCAMWDRFMEWRYSRSAKGTEQDISKLCTDSQIILKQYMEPMYHNGKQIYIVRDVKKFDAFISAHMLYNDGEYRGCNLDECIKESLAKGNGFIIFINGQEYVAFPPVNHVDAEYLKRQAEESKLKG